MPGASMLVVEDEAALASAVADALRDAGYVVERAADGEEALARVKAQAFDLVICDLKMPRLDGMAFYQTLVGRHARPCADASSSSPATWPAPTPRGSSKRAAAAGSRSRSGWGIC